MHNFLKKFRNVILALAIAGCVTPGSTSSNDFKVIPLLRLIVLPADYDQERVFVKGFLSGDPTNSYMRASLYLNENDFLYDITDNAIAIEVTSDMAQHIKDNDEQYVLIVGTFSSKEKGPWSAYSGTLKEIQRIEALQPINMKR